MSIAPDHPIPNDTILASEKQLSVVETVTTPILPQIASRCRSAGVFRVLLTNAFACPLLMCRLLSQRNGIQIREQVTTSL